MKNNPIWDIPTRLFHWIILCAVAASWASHEFDEPEVHLWAGYTVLVMVSFRLLWGLFGSVHARFTDFLRRPSAVLDYLRGDYDPSPGHNPAGGWAVVSLLILLMAQALSGLFNSDGLLFDGPFYYALDSVWTNKIGAAHEYIFWALSSLICLHIAAVLYYQFKRRQDIVRPMFTGGTGGAEAPRPLWLALVLVSVCAIALAVALNLAPEPDLPW